MWLLAENNGRTAEQARGANSPMSSVKARSLSQTLERDGYFVLSNVLSPVECELVTSRLPSIASAGTRNLLDYEDFRLLASHLRNTTSLNGLLSRYVTVQCILFVKTLEHNWWVGLHRDEVMPMSGQGNWQDAGMKEGLPYVRVPSAVLGSMVAVRLHLDGAPEGDLSVVPGSHTNDDEPNRAVAFSIPVPNGGALVMRPRLLHASSKLRSSSSRRVLHFVFAPASCLPQPYQWCHAA
jgi:Phytanoyl-CoA dioxygenase (PhyH)